MNTFYTKEVRLKYKNDFSKGRLFQPESRSRFLFLLLGMVLMNFTVAYAQPINDEWTAAIPIDVTVEREYTQLSNQLATASPDMPLPDCGNYQGGDVWFKVEMPGSGILRMDVQSTYNPKYAAAVYTENSGVMTLITCSEVGANGNVNSRITLNDPDIAGEDIYVRVFRYGSTSGGWFKVSAYTDFPMVPNDTPYTPLVLDNTDGTFERQGFNTEDATSTSMAPIPSCGAFLGKDVWFETTIPASGKLNIESEPGTITPVVVVYTGTTNNLTEYACSFNGLIDNGGEVLIDDIALAGQTVLIRVFGHNNAAGGCFEIVILEPSQDVCNDAIELTNITETETYRAYTNQYALPANDGNQMTCGIFKDKDIWFKVNVPSNGALTIDSKVDAVTNVMPVITVYTGSCGALVYYDCDFWGSTRNPFGAKVEINDMGLANQDIYIRMYGYDEEIGGAFDLAVYQPAALPVELISFRADVVNNEEVLLNWQTATEINNDYFIIEHSVDGAEYTPVGHVAGRGTTSETQSYLFTHDEPFFGVNYYRLKQVDLDGSFEYSNVVTATITMEAAKILIYPNPAFIREGVTVRWVGDFGKDAVQISITNSIGKQVYLKRVHLKDQDQLKIDFSNLQLTAGVYYITVMDKNSLIAHQKVNLVKD